MKGASVRLTKTVVDRLEADGSERFVAWDAELAGFGVRVSATGVKTYVARYRAGGGRSGTLRQQVLGRHGVLTTDQAREAARKVIAAAVLGDDPQGVRAAKRAEPTVAEVCDAYQREGAAAKKASTRYIDGRRIERHIRPVIGRKRIGDVTRADVQKLLNVIAEGKPPIERGGRAAATRTVGLLGAIFEFALERRLIKANPARGVRRFADNKRERFLTAAELGRVGDILAAREAADWRPVAILRLLLFTGARKNEIARLRWSEVDLERGVLLLGDSKSGRKPITLNAPALAVLSGLKRQEGNPYVFPANRGGAGPWTGIDLHWAEIRKAAEISDCRVHDIRHTHASVGAAAGFGLPMIGKILGHKHVSTTARYAHLADDPVRAAAERIGSAVAAQLERGRGEVTPARRA